MVSGTSPVQAEGCSTPNNRKITADVFTVLLASSILTPPGNSGTNNSPRHNHFIHTHTTMPVLYTAMVGQEHKMGIVIQTLLPHLVNELAYFHIRLFNGTYIFGGHPFVLMPCMVSMDRIEKDQGRTVPVFH